MNRRYLQDTEIDAIHSGYTIKSISVTQHAGITFQGLQQAKFHSGVLLLEKDGDELVDNWIQQFRGEMPYIAFDNWFAPAEYEKLAEMINQAIVDFNLADLPEARFGGYRAGTPGSRW